MTTETTRTLERCEHIEPASSWSTGRRCLRLKGHQSAHRLVDDDMAALWAAFYHTKEAADAANQIVAADWHEMKALRAASRASPEEDAMSNGGGKAAPTSFPHVACPTCRDTGLRLEPGEETQTYCDCPIGLAFGAVWMGTGHEEEGVEAIVNLVRFLRASPEEGRWRSAVLSLGKCPACRSSFRDACTMTPKQRGCALCAPSRLLLMGAEIAAVRSPASPEEGRALPMPPPLSCRHNGPGAQRVTIVRECQCGDISQVDVTDLALRSPPSPPTEDEGARCKCYPYTHELTTADGKPCICPTCGKRAGRAPASSKEGA